MGSHTFLYVTRELPSLLILHNRGIMKSCQFMMQLKVPPCLKTFAYKTRLRTELATCVRTIFEYVFREMSLYIICVKLFIYFEII